MITNKPMTGEQLDELMTVAVNMQRDSEKAGDRPTSMFAYAVQVAVMELRQIREMKPVDENHVAAMNSIKAIIAILGSSDTLGISEQVAELKAQRDALAAELSAIDAIHSEAVFITDEHYEQCPPEVQKMIRSLAVLQIPAYQAFLAEVRASTIETTADDLASQNNIGAHEHNAMYIYAENFRKGVQS